MNDEIDYELSAVLWETLKTLRTPVSKISALSRFALEDLAELGFVSMSGNLPVITPKGRKVLIRGSSRLLDVAA